MSKINLHELTQEEFSKLWNESLSLYEEKWSDSDSVFETDSHPMHPSLFYQLSNVSGFNKTNGYTYPEYIDQWYVRRSIDSE